MAANMAAKTDFIDISGDKDAIMENNVSKPMFGAKKFVEAKFNNKGITVFKMAANMAAKTDFIDISGDKDAIIENKVSKPMFSGSRNL